MGTHRGVQLMRVPHNESRPAVRASWLDAVVVASQQVAGQCDVIDPEHVHHLLTAFARALPTPASVVERLIMRALLLDVAWRSGRTIHARAHRGHAGRCPFVPTTHLDRFWSAPRQDPVKAFLGWAQAFSEELKRIHPASAASRVARLIRHEYHLQWSLATLGRRFHVTPSQLRRGFKREFGVSIHEYQQVMRVKAAIEHVRNGNIEATALEAGYGSKKNFYRAFRRVTGLTPAAFRRLSHERALHVVESLAAAPPRRAIAADRRP